MIYRLVRIKKKNQKGEVLYTKSVGVAGQL